MENAISVEGSEVMLVFRLVDRIRERQREEVARMFHAFCPLLAPVPSPSLPNPPLHRNRFNLLPPLRVFTPSHYSPISYCLILYFFWFPDTLLITRVHISFSWVTRWKLFPLHFFLFRLRFPFLLTSPCGRSPRSTVQAKRTFSQITFPYLSLCNLAWNVFQKQSMS